MWLEVEIWRIVIGIEFAALAGLALWPTFLELRKRYALWRLARTVRRFLREP